MEKLLEDYLNKKVDNWYLSLDSEGKYGNEAVYVVDTGNYYSKSYVSLSDLLVFIYNKK